MKWNYDREMGWHTLPADETAKEFVFVYKTGAGDYAVSAMREGDIGGDDVTFRNTLNKAKKFGEHLISTGEYKEYFL